MSALGAAAAQAASGVARADQLARKGLDRQERRREVKRSERDVDGDEVNVAPEAIEGAEAVRPPAGQQDETARRDHPQSYTQGGRPRAEAPGHLDVEA
ncbi:MAG: hypothetical protein KF866_12795 [Phycisphaeraceae bacterium]|nr:hypothetical protein [Phycisphaeraceae bacterium]MCW5754135.1 hypothetical protein [Phycisphaeraceae bacterium]